MRAFRSPSPLSSFSEHRVEEIRALTRAASDRGLADRARRGGDPSLAAARARPALPVRALRRAKSCFSRSRRTRMRSVRGRAIALLGRLLSQNGSGRARDTRLQIQTRSFVAMPAKA